MSRVFDYITKGSLKKILASYSEAFGTPITLMDPDKKFLLGHPDSPPHGDIAGETALVQINVRDNTIGFVAVPKESGACLGFIGDNLSGIAEMGFEIESLSGEVARSYEELSLLWKISSKLGAGLNVDRICSVLAEEAMGICPSTNVSVMLLSEMPSGLPEDACLEPENAHRTGPSFFFPKVSLGSDSSRASTMVLSAEGGLLGGVYKKKEPVTICDVGKLDGFKYPVRRILVVPLVLDDTVIGAVVANDKLDGEEYYSTEIKLISSIASECAISIKKALLFDEIREMLFSTAEAFSLAVEAKDPYTYGHSKRVSELSATIAGRLGFSQYAVSWVKLAALLHDIGKIGTPEVILDKVSGLDPEEMAQMKEHPALGARMIENIRRMREISRWICLHHEKWDGTGYPLGLKGEDIPLPSRIIAVADFFDALSSDRPYRKALTKKDALLMMRGLSGKHFDPKVLKCFEGI